MGNKSSTTQYFVNSRNIDTSQSQTDTTHVPVDVSAMINPGKFEGTAEEQMALYDYISQLNIENSLYKVLDESLNFDTFCNMYVDTYFMESIQKAKENGEYDSQIAELEAMLLERGVFSAIFTGISNLMSGKVSISQNFLKMINAATTRITAVSKATLGEGITNRLLDGMRASAPSLKKFMDEVYSGLTTGSSMNEQHEGDSIAPAGATTSAALKNSGLLGNAGGGWLPPDYKNGNNRAQLPNYRAGLFKRGDNTTNFQLAYANYQDILSGSNKVNLNLTQNAKGEDCYQCPAAAIMCEQHQTSLKTTGDIVSNLLSPMITSELIQVTAQANLAAAFGSPPSIANIPNTDQINAIIDNIPIEQQPAAAEQVRQNGARYGLTIDDTSDPNAVASPDSDIIQMLVDYTPVNTSDGANIRNIRLMKETYNRMFPAGLHTFEALIASPTDISLRDVPVPNSASIPWDEAVDAIKNNCGGGTWVTTKPTDWPNTAPVPPDAQDYYNGTPWLSTGVNAVNMTSGATVFAKKPYSCEEFKSIIAPYPIYMAACPLGCNFKVRPIYSDYNITFQLDLSYWELTDSKGFAQPGLFFVGGPITDGGGKPLERHFIPAAQHGNSMLYSISIATENTTNAALKNLFGAEGIFTLGVGWRMGDKNNLPVEPYAFSLSIISGRALLSRSGTSPNLGCWIVNGKACSDTFISQIFTITMLDEITSHPADVSYFWRTVVAPLFTPFLRSIMKLVKDKNNMLAIAGITVQLQQAAVDPKDFATYTQVTDWLVSVIAEFNSWMLYRGDSPIVKLTTAGRGKVLWCVICLMRAFTMITIYVEPNSQTVTSAMRNLSVLFKDDNEPPAISQETRQRYQVLEQKTQQLKAAKTNMALGHMSRLGFNNLVHELGHS